MIERIKIGQLSDYFLKMSERKPAGVFFCRIDQYSDELEAFLIQYISSIKKNGKWLDKKIKNPDENQLSYYDNIVGSDFILELNYIKRSLKLLFGNLSQYQIDLLSEAVFAELIHFKNVGKNENIIKNAFIKFMCWFYYEFRQVIGNIGSDNPPKILYDGVISNYELSTLAILSNSGCDIVLLRYDGEERYRSVDSALDKSEKLLLNAPKNFPEDFSILAIQKATQEQQYLEQLYRSDKLRIPATNTWLSGDFYTDVLKLDRERGNTEDTFYNAFIRMTGVEDKKDYCKDLFHLKIELEKKGKTVYILEKITPPTPDEITKIKVGNYTNTVDMIKDLVGKIRCPNPILRNQAQKAFVDFIIEENQNEGGKFSRLKNKAVYLVAWFSRYEQHLFKSDREENLPVLIYFGYCKNPAEVLLLRFFASLPLDVLLINPDTQYSCTLSDARLFDIKYNDSLTLDKFPEKIEDVNYGTVAYHAEQDLNTVLYQDSGLYRQQQYKDAIAVKLKTMYEEIYLLWDHEVNLRPNFEIIEGKVVIPVIGAKVCGVKNDDIVQYWKDVKKLLVEDTLLISETSFYKMTGEKFNSQNAIRNRVLHRESILRNRNYKYGIFREEIQEYMLNKLQELLDSGLIHGTFTTGIEHSIISIVMDLDKNITRLIQKMDFTKKNPKLVLINTSEKEYGLEESIILAYLYLIGFDIVLFVPTGYRVIEKYYTQQIFTEHLIGEFKYDMKIPSYIQGNRLNEQEEKDGFLKRLLKR